MELGLEGRTVVVTGASKGIGLATAVALAQEGSRVALIARGREALEAAAVAVAKAGAADVEAFASDVANREQVQEVVLKVLSRFGSIYGLANVVGPYPERMPSLEGGLKDLDDELWEGAFRGILMSKVWMCKAIIPHMLHSGSGAIVNVAAQSARQHMPFYAHYSVHMAAVLHFTKDLAKEFGRGGVRANAVLPGWIKSPSGTSNMEDMMQQCGLQTEAELIDWASCQRGLYRMTWSDRLGLPAEIGEVAAFLLSDRASYVNGACLNVDGGSTGG
jgi:3-oxoacyl-[acyl-carrier protein] reductase